MTVSDWPTRMSRIKEYIAGLLLLTVFLLCFGSAVTSSEKLSGRGSVYMLYHTDEPMDGKNAVKRQQENGDSENPLDFTLWGYQENQSVSYEEFSREMQTGIVYICGSSSLLFGEQGKLEQDDKQGCLISKDVAEKLYGNQDIKGSVLTYNGVDYTVRAVVDDVSETVVLQADEKTKAVIDAAALRISGLESETLKAYQNRYGGSEKSIKLSSFSEWGRKAAGLLLWLVGAVLILPALKTGFRLRREPVRCLVWFAAVAALTVVYWQVGREYLSPSVTVSPPMWSDFSYWKGYLSEQGEAVRQLLIVEKRPPEQIYVDSFIKTLGYTIVSVIIFFSGFKKWKMKRLGDVYLYSIVHVIICFAAIRLSGSRVLAENYSYWLFMPVYFTGSYLLNLLMGKVKVKKILEAKLLP